MRRAVPAIAAVLALALVVGCGGDDDSEEPAEQGSQPQQEAKQGGDLTVMYAADVDKIDPGQTYYQYGMNVAYATQRPLYSYKPDDAKNLEPDLAEGPPEIAADGKSRHGEDPHRRQVQPAGRTARSPRPTSSTALERGFLPTVAGPYVGAYMGSLKGLKAFQDGDAKEITGIKTPGRPDDRPRARRVRAAPSWPPRCRCRRRRPCRRSTRQKFDKRQPSAYGENQVATGPYMVEDDESGKLTGYTPGDRDQARPQPELGRVDRLQARLPGLDHDQGGQQARRRLATDPRGQGAWCPATSSSRPRSSRERLDGRPEGPDGADRRRPGASATSRSGPTGRRSTTRTCGARSTRRSTRRRCGRRSAARSPATSRRTTSRPASRASRRPAARRAQAPTSWPSRRATSSWRRST